MKYPDQVSRYQISPEMVICEWCTGESWRFRWNSTDELIGNGNIPETIYGFLAAESYAVLCTDALMPDGNLLCSNPNHEYCDCDEIDGLKRYFRKWMK